MIRAGATAFLWAMASVASAMQLTAADFASIESRAGIPDKVLYSIALTESGRNGKPWPWTMNYAGRAFYFKDRETLHDAMNLLIANGKRNFDVGPMQINWRYHSNLFASTWEATDPHTNMVAGAQILIDRFNQYGNWVKAIATYHSKTEHLGQIYLANFARNYSRTKKEQM